MSDRRVLAGAPSFTLTALAKLALAIGVNTAVFALVIVLGVVRVQGCHLARPVCALLT